jgi:hypothetical protein
MSVKANGRVASWSELQIAQFDSRNAIAVGLMLAREWVPVRYLQCYIQRDAFLRRPFVYGMRELPVTDNAQGLPPR